MAARPPLPEILARRSFTFHEGLAAGTTPSRMRAKDLSIPSREVRVPKDAQQTLLERVRPYTVLNENSCVSHVTAAQLHGMPLPWFEDEIRTIHLTRPAGSNRPRRTHVTGHSMRLPRQDTMLIQGVRVTKPARTFLDLACLLTLEALVAVADFLICEHDRHFEQPKRALVSAAELGRFIAGQRHVPGLRKARQALELMRVGVDSPPETRLRLLLRRGGLPEFTTNYAIHGKSGEYDVHPDLACAAYKVSAQYEGEIHQTTERQLWDRNRDERTADRGWLQVKVYAADMRRGDAYVVAMVTKALIQQGWRPSE